MKISQPDPAARRFRWPHAAALVAGGAIVGGIAAASLTAGAATTAPSPSAGSSSSSGSSPGAGSSSGYGSGPGAGSTRQPPAGGHEHGSSPVRSDEKAVSAADAATLKAAALKAVPGATVYRIETDAGDGSYEAHLTKADGSEATVKFDKNLAVTKVEAGMGSGDPAPSGH